MALARMATPSSSPGTPAACPPPSSASSARSRTRSAWRDSSSLSCSLEPAERRAEGLGGGGGDNRTGARGGRLGGKGEGRRGGGWGNQGFPLSEMTSMNKVNSLKKKERWVRNKIREGQYSSTLTRLLTFFFCGILTDGRNKPNFFLNKHGCLVSSITRSERA